MIFKKKDKELKPKKERHVPVMKIGTHKKTVIALWLVMIASVSFGVYKNFTAIDMHTVHEKEVIEQRIVDTNKIENFVKAFAKSYYSWSNTQESIDARTAAINNYLTKSLQDLNVDTVRVDIPTSSTVTDVKIWNIEQTGTDDFTVVYSVDQTVTEGEQSIGYTSAYMVVVHVDSDGNMVITQNPTISSIPTKSSYEPKAKESDGTVDAATTEEVTEFLETFFKLYPTATETRFSEIPLFQISWIGLVVGAVVGFIIVLLASLSPAKKAAKVSPITAISGNTQLTNKKAANTQILHVETSMGIFHAMSSKKNVFLMTCSFAISIVLFLSFQVMVVFLNQGMPALSPSAADVSITMENSYLDKALIQEINSLDGIDKVYGRMEESGIPISDENGTITLVSYDDNQFKWAKDELNSGKITPVQENAGYVLVTYFDEMTWNVGDIVTLHTAMGDKQVTIAGILATTSAKNSAGSNGYMICSEETFVNIAGDLGYVTIDVQLSDTQNDDTVSTIRNMLPNDSSVSDKRLSNSESQSSYYTGAIFIYGFLIIIALITVFNIFNSMNASVASRTKQYGIMRAIGMSMNQLYKMIAAEAATYAMLGCIIGCVLGVPLNKMMFQFLIADKWGTNWNIPISSLLLIVLLCLVSATIAIRRPIKQISKIAIVDTIRSQQ